jgi:putative flippase GtrA
MMAHGPGTQLLRYGIVGVGTNLAGYLVYLGLTWAGVEPKLAMSGLYALGVGVSFALNRRWTFGHRGRVGPAGLRFGAAHLLGYAINLGMLAILHDALGWPHELVQALAFPVLAIYFFLSHRFFVFPDRFGR